MQLGPALPRCQQAPQYLYGVLVLAEARQRNRLQREGVLVARIELQQAGELLARPAVLQPIDQHPGIVGSCRAVRRCELDCLREKAFCAVEGTALMLDSPQQPQSLGVATHAAQIFAQDAFRQIQIAVTEQAARLDDLWRQAAQRGDLLSRGHGVARIARSAIQPLEHAPARQQRRIDADGALESLDRARHIVHCREAMPAFLVPDSSQLHGNVIGLQLRVLRFHRQSLLVSKGALSVTGERPGKGKGYREEYRSASVSAVARHGSDGRLAEGQHRQSSRDTRK